MTITFYYSGQDHTVAVKECGTGNTLSQVQLAYTSFNMQQGSITIADSDVGKRGYMYFDDHHTGGWDHIQFDSLVVAGSGGISPC